MANWSDLPNDLVRRVSSSVSLPDRHRLSSVCKNWHLIGDEKSTHPFSPELPWLVHGEDPETRKRNFFNISEEKPYSIDIPELYGQHICGSSFGWLFTIDLGLKCRLLNPFTRDSIELPPLPPYSNTSNLIVTEEPAVRDAKGNEIGWTFKEMQRQMIFKGILSHDPRERSDFTAMIIFGMDYSLAIWRPGDISWTVAEGPPEEDDFILEDDFIWLMDVIYFKGNFFAVSDRRYFFAVDVGSVPKLTRIDPRVPRFEKIRDERYLVDLKGELIFIRRFTKHSYRKPKKEIRVLRLDRDKQIWEELDDISGAAIFVGNNSAVVVDPTIFPNCVGNAIYLADTCSSLRWDNTGHQFGVYSMVDKSMGPFCLTDDLVLSLDAPLVWVTPNV